MRSSWFSSDVTVISAEKKCPTLLSWPSNEQNWLKLLENIYSRHALDMEEGQLGRSAKQDLVDRAISNGVATKIHCECAIIAHLH